MPEPAGGGPPAASPPAGGDPAGATLPVARLVLAPLAALVGELGRRAIALVGETGSLTVTGWRGSATLARALLPGERLRGQSIIVQCYLVGVQAIPIVALISFMIGLILALQSAYQLERLGAEMYVANLVAVAMTRELGPLMTAIVVAGRSGSAIAAEIGTMKVHEEIDALKVMGINPTSFLVMPRLAALLICLPLLTAMADLLGILGGLACAVLTLDIPVNQYVLRSQEAIVLRDFVSGLVKACVFAWIIAVVGAACGFAVDRGAEGVGRATTRAVVLSIFLVIVADVTFTGLFYRFT